MLKQTTHCSNISALLRRATTYKHQNKLQDAVGDLRQVLDVEPDNELAKVSTGSDSHRILWLAVCVFM